MKRTVLPIIMALVLTSCSTYQYSSRSVDVRNRSIETKGVAAEVVVDYERTVTATSDYQMSRGEAIKEAEYLCIISNKIDVVVDPIIKVEFSPFEFKKKYRATITGFAGMYKPASAGVDAVKDYSKEDIEKYKLLTDPSFPQYYYNNGSGDSYYINSSAGQSVKQSGSLFSSLAVAPKAKTPKAPKTYDFYKAKTLRNAGIGLTIAGVVSVFAIGLPVGYLARPGSKDTAVETMIFFHSTGFIATAVGIPMWCIGSSRMKKSGDIQVSMGGTSNGLGLRLNF